MGSHSPHEITHLLQRWRGGDEAARDAVMAVIQAELHRLARAYMRRERRDHTLQATALVNETYLRLAGQNRVHWRSRAQFIAVAAQFMRRILIDHARAHLNVRRGGPGRVTVTLDEALVSASDGGPVLVALDEALHRLAAIDCRKARVVELRYFGGLSVEETAGVLGVAPITVMRDWSLAKAWLRQALSSHD
jgi:RNA polymerase sigma-70 factor, ECF subfamily